MRDCPLCVTPASQAAVSTAHRRRWFACPHCALVFCHESELPSLEEERARYEHHQNSATDSNYVSYLRRLLDPFTGLLTPDFQGLDFGAGEESVVRELLRTQGFEVETWDPIFQDSEDVLDRTYDFVTATEVVEHFHDPQASFGVVNRLLKPGGVFGVLTQLWPGEKAFPSWFYARDFTHVCFYSERSFEVLARMFGWEIVYAGGGDEGREQSRGFAVVFRKG